MADFVFPETFRKISQSINGQEDDCNNKSKNFVKSESSRTAGKKVPSFGVDSDQGNCRKKENKLRPDTQIWTMLGYNC